MKQIFYRGIPAALLLASSFSVATSAQQAANSAATAPSASEKKENPPKPVSEHQADEAERAYLQGTRLFLDGRVSQAEEHFLQAVKLNPARTEYVRALSLSQENRITNLVQMAAQERQHNRPDKAEQYLSQARALDPNNPLLRQHQQPLLQTSLPGTMHPLSITRNYANAIKLEPNQMKFSFHQRMQTQAMMQDVANKYGIHLDFNADAGSTSLRLDIDDVDYATVMHVLTMMTGTMVVPLDAHTALVAKSTEDNHKQLDRLEEETLYFPGHTAEQLQMFGNILRNLFEIQHVSVQPSSSTVVISALPSTVQAVNQTFEDLIDDSNEIMLRLQLYTMNHSVDRDTGLTLPQQISLNSFASLAQEIVTNNSSAVQQLISSGVISSSASNYEIALLLIASGLVTNSAVSGAIAKIGGGLTSSLLSTTSTPTLQLALTNSDSRELEDVQLRAQDNQNTNFRVGSRYPITTSTYSSSISSSSSLTVNGVSLSSLLGGATTSTIPLIQYQDLGLTVKTTPIVQRGGEVALHIEMKIDSLTGGSLNNIPILSSRSFTSDMIVPPGATAMMMSDVTQEQLLSISGTPGLSAIPGFQGLQGRDMQKVNNSLILLVTPMLIKHNHTQMTGPYIPVEIRTTD